MTTRTNKNFTRRIVLIVLVIAAILSMAAPAFAATETVNAKDYPYTSLAAAANAVKVNVQARKTSNKNYDFYFTVGYKATTYNKTTVTNTVKNQIYAHTGKVAEGDALNPMIAQLGISVSSTKSGNYYYVKITVYGKYNLTAAQQKEYTNWVNTKAAAIKKSAKTEYAKALAVYQLVIKTAKYGYTKVGNLNTYQTGYGAIKKTATCYGISQLVYDLMNAVGVSCRVARTSTHAWNVVNIGGKWYAVDATRGASAVNMGTTASSPAVKNFFLKGSNAYKDNAKRLTNVSGGAIVIQVKDYAGK